MSWIEDKLTEQFYRWELRGRGWHVCDHPVRLEPSFRPFIGHFVQQHPQRDDGRRHTLFSDLLDRVGKSFSTEDEIENVATGAEEEEPLPELWERKELVESQVILPRERRFSREAFESLLLSLSSCAEPVSFEVLGTHEAITIQFACDPRDAPLLRRQLQGRFPGIGIHEAEHALLNAWSEGAPSFAVAEFGLAREFMLTLDTSGEWQAGLFAALSELAEKELGLFQVIFQPVRERWAESALLAVTDGTGGPFFVNRPELIKEAAHKFSSPLFSVVLRIAASADDSERAWRVIAEMASGLASLAKPDGNHLVPLANTGYGTSDHEEDLLLRQSRRAGMLLNLDELVSLVQFPAASVRAPKLRQDTGRTRAMPLPARDGSIVLGENVHADVAQTVSLSIEQRVRHLHIIGASGTGKSTLLFNLIRQDIENGEGLAVLDPHGDLIERVLGIIPEERMGDVILVDPSDELYSVGCNILSAHSDFEKTLLASDLVSVFQRLSTSWGDQMGSVLNNVILAFLESSEGGTLADLRRFLLDATWRKNFLRTVQDPDIVYYWEKGFPQLGGNKSIGPVLTRLESFLAPKPIRYMVSQRENKLDFADITDSGKIFLAKLSQGQMGRENAHLLGSLMVSKFQQTAMARQRMSADQRRPFWLYIDEFQNFITPSMAEILSGARKYRMGLTLAHQELAQLKREPEVASAVLSNAGTRVVFRVSENDARALEDGFAHFTAREIQSLDTGEAICRIERSDTDFNLSVPWSESENEAQIADMRERVIALSRKGYATPRAEIEAELRRKSESTEQSDPSIKKSEREVAQRASSEELSATRLSPAPVAVEGSSSPTPLPTSRKTPEIPAILGKGGEVHQTTQLELKALAEGLGFRATIEKQLPGTLESTDLLLERNGLTIAVEITVTNTLDYELKNIGKCLRVGVSQVIVIGSDAEKLTKIETAARTRFGDQHRSELHFFTKETFHRHLQGVVVIPPKPDTQETTKMHKGWRVKTTVVNLTPEEVKEREGGVARILAESMRRGEKTTVSNPS